MKCRIDLFQWASGHFLTEHLPDNYMEMSEEELRQYCVDHAWEPMEDWEPECVLEQIETLAASVEKLLKENQDDGVR